VSLKNQRHMVAYPKSCNINDLDLFLFAYIPTLQHYNITTHRHHSPIKTVLLGSSPLLLQKGFQESLGGRFELIRLSHWSFKEMKEAFGVSLEEYIYFGGYPGAAKTTFRARLPLFDSNFVF
jgi:hypothetical protein